MILIEKQVFIYSTTYSIEVPGLFKTLDAELTLVLMSRVVGVIAVTDNLPQLRHAPSLSRRLDENLLRQRHVHFRCRVRQHFRLLVRDAQHVRRARAPLFRRHVVDICQQTPDMSCGGFFKPTSHYQPLYR